MYQTVAVDGQPPTLRVDFFDALISRTFCPMSCEASGEARRCFDGRLEVNTLNKVALAQVSSTPLNVFRRRDHIARVSEANYLVKFQIRGEGVFRQREREAHLRPGDFVLCSTSEPYSLHFSGPYSQAVLSVPQALLGDLVRSPESYLGVRMAADRPVNGLLSQFVHSLAERMDRIEPGLAQRLEANVLDLLVTALSFSEDRGRESVESADSHLHRIRLFIHKHLGDPDLTPDRIATEHRISTRYLHMLFKPLGVSVSRFIQLQRLEACRRCLARSDMQDLSASEIAFRWGFNDSSHFSRLFKAEYGVTPKAYRHLPSLADNR